MNTNYLQVANGHCYICHTIYDVIHTCSGTPTPCRIDCPILAIDNYPDSQKYKYCPHCGHEL